MNANMVDKIIGTHVVLMSKSGKMDSLWLPEPPEGKFRFGYASGEENVHDLYFEARQGKWFACSPKYNFFKNRFGEICSAIEMFDKCIFSLNKVEQTDVVYAESVFETSGVFHNYFVDSLAEINIGRSNKNDIVYPNPLVSHTHAVLRRVKNAWSIEDLNSTNGVFVNGSKVSKTELHLGDNIYIMGLRIIIGIGFISINDGNNRILIASNNLHRSQPAAKCELPERISDESEDKELFNRLPRKRKALNANPIVIEAPPISLNSNNIPLLLRMGSPMIMSSASLLAGNITSILSSVLFPVLTQKYTEKQRKEYEDRRNSKYNEYLQKKHSEIIAERELESAVLNHNYPEINRVISFTDTKERLWERRVVDDDFMSLRIGSGNYPLLAACEAPSRGFEIDEDPLMEKMYQLTEEPVLLENAPVMASFIDDDVCGVLGEREIAIEFIHQLMVQLTLLHSYDEVKLVLLAEQKELNRLEFIKYVPHVWNDQRDFRFVATDTSSGYQISEYLKREVETDLKKQRDLKEILEERPYYIVFALSKRIFDSMEVLKDIMQTDRNCGISVVAVFDDLPKECSKIFNLKASGEHAVVSLKQIDKEDEYFQLDHMDSARALQSMKEISNTSLKVITQAYSLPKTVTFLEMFGVGCVEHLNPLKRWKDNNPVRSLATPVGVATDGSLFMLDLHEKFQGPHGLVAGMTGSGKSEFLITYILSMAVNYHPDEVAFVLIDYKGGGLADAFDNPEKGIHLPHLVGTITNLDGSSIQRSLRSLNSEVLRRQQVFKKAKTITEEATMDIYKYQKLYRNGQIDEPMPHLFIISDEFAELKQQKPEFMDNLISIARIGRSLGVHLILATQKPSGVVNDQIRSNTKFRVCLKVQEKADSQDMLKRPEAAELKDTGRFYLQVGYNEFFAMGQSAWTGADYAPMNEVAIQKDNSLEFLDNTGQVIAKSKPNVNKKNSDMKQIVAVVKYLAEIAKAQRIYARPLWKPDLPAYLDLDELQKQYHQEHEREISALIGLIDDPESQSQYPLALDLVHSHNTLIVGTSGCGKTTLIKTILLSLTRQYSPEKLNYYILDFSGGALGIFKNAPHCGAFLTENDEESIKRFIGMLRDLIQERKNMFMKAGVSNYESFTEEYELPLILLVIDNFAGLAATENGNTYFSTFHEYLRESSSLGIQIMISCNNLNEVSARSKQELGYRITLQLKDRFAYQDVLNGKCTLTPPMVNGRGLCVHEEKIKVYHVAIPYPHLSEHERTKLLISHIEELSKNYAGEGQARKLPVLTDDEAYAHFCNDISLERIPLGYDIKTVRKISIPFSQLYCMPVYFGNSKGISPIMNNLAYAVHRDDMDLLVVKRKDDSALEQIGQRLSKQISDRVFSCTADDSLRLCHLLIDQIKTRKVFRNEYCTLNGIPISKAKSETVMKQAGAYIRKKTKPMMILFEDFYEFSSNLQVGCFDVLKNIFENGKGYNIYFAAGFYSEAKEKVSVDMLTKCFIRDEFMLFFGGQYQNQGLTVMPMEYKKITTPLKEYNRFVMKYHGEFYSLIMPCGSVLDDDVDSDDAPII